MSFSAGTKMFWFFVCFLLGSCSFATATKSQHVDRTSRAATRQDAHQVTPPVADAQVDVFLDLACPDSAAAWPTIKKVFWEYGFRTKFVFHILPASQNQVALDAAKALQLLRMHSADSDEVVLFIDAMLIHHNEIINVNAADDDMTRLEVFDILASSALVECRFTEDEFIRGMEDPLVDDLVQNELEVIASLGVYETPTADLNGIFRMHLVGDEALQDFRLFVREGMTPKPIVFDIEGTKLARVDRK